MEPVAWLPTSERFARGEKWCESIHLWMRGTPYGGAVVSSQAGEWKEYWRVSKLYISYLAPRVWYWLHEVLNMTSESSERRDICSTTYMRQPSHPPSTCIAGTDHSQPLLHPPDSATARKFLESKGTRESDQIKSN